MEEYPNRLTSTQEVKEINKERFRRINKSKDRILKSEIYIQKVKEDNKLIAAHIRVEDPNEDPSNPFKEWYLKYFIYIYNVNNIKHHFKYPWFLKINLQN